MKGIIAAFAIAGLATDAAAAPLPAPPPPCVTPAQVTDVVLFALPSVLDAAAAKCRPSLAANAYLLNGGHALSERLAVDAPRHWQGAMNAMKSFGDKKMPEGISADTARSLVRDVMTAELMKKITPADCVRIDEAAALLAPLPPENLGRLVALALDAMGEGKKGSPRICR
jgi:hypothetical protein